MKIANFPHQRGGIIKRAANFSPRFDHLAERRITARRGRERPMETSVTKATSAVDQYRHWRSQFPAQVAADKLCGFLDGADEQDWLEVARALMMEYGMQSAQPVLAAAIVAHPRSIELRRALGGVYRRIGHDAKAEEILRQLLEEKPDDVSTALALAEMLKEQGRVRAAAECLRSCMQHHSADVKLAIWAIEFLDGCDCKADAAAVASAAIAANPDDARLHAYAGMLQLQLGDFERAREHYLHALSHSEQGWEWNIPLGLSQTLKYRSAEHPDFALYAKGLAHPGLSDRARSALLFTSGKACDDVGEYANAARYFRDANALAGRLTKWTLEHWERMVEARRAAAALPARSAPPGERAPVFIVGLPRSGTTLVAELLARYPRVCSRGELPWIAWLFDRSMAEAKPSLDRLAAAYMAQLRRDDSDAQWFIDKQPHNFHYVDFMLALWPQAKIIYCERNPRDNALSLWMQAFLEDVQGFSYSFDHIGRVMDDCRRLMHHWRERYPASIRTLRYESLVRDPQARIAELAEWIGIAGSADVSTAPAASSSISTASLWQARQPVYASSVGRWHNYLPFVPELAAFAEE
jgi:tetratricopeptide (TPR) repeat protein